jgi:high-affinity K+ transport system ATPase subunit B
LKNMDSINDNDLDTHNLDQNYGNAEEYYKRVLSGSSAGSSGISGTTNVATPNHQTINVQSDALMQKINYMINLLEEQQDERTNNVTEEVVLYSFLGIFVIFVVDSFVKVGKYVR